MFHSTPAKNRAPACPVTCPVGETIVTVNRNKWLFSISLWWMYTRDVHPCPGPVQSTTSKSKKSRYPCVKCGGAVRGNSRAVSCDGCDEWTHLSCSTISAREYRSSIITGAEIYHTCNRCILLAQPLFGDVEEDRSESKEEDKSVFFPSESDFFDCLKSKGLHFLHLDPRIIFLRSVQGIVLKQNLINITLYVPGRWRTIRQKLLMKNSVK